MLTLQRLRTGGNQTVTVSNVAPTITANGSNTVTVTENGTATLTGTITDVGTLDTHPKEDSEDTKE